MAPDEELQGAVALTGSSRRSWAPPPRRVLMLDGLIARDAILEERNGTER